jgi:dolichol-phosphate mannosyltransferase
MTGRSFVTGQTMPLEATTQANQLPATRRFLRFASSSLVATLIDQLLAWELFALLDPILAGADFTRILLSCVAARLVSLSVNFSINSRLVFGGLDSDSRRRTFARFLALAAFVLMLSTTGVYLAHTLLGAPEWQAKILCDLVLFFLNYALQKSWVFSDATQAGCRLEQGFADRRP